MTNTVESVWKKVERRASEECWPWVGRHRASNGYGRLDIGNEEGVYAHRAAYLSANPGSIPLRAPEKSANEPTFVLHRCDNPACCNPAHLFLGTHTDNMQDKAKKGRSPDFRGERAPRAKLTSAEAEEIHRVLAYGMASSELAGLFGVSKPTIKSIRSGRHYGGFQ